MKLVKGFLIILIIFSTFLILSYIYNLFFKIDPLKLLEKIYEKNSEIKEYSLNYSLLVTIAFDDIATEVKGSVDIVAIDGNQKAILTLNQTSLYDTKPTKLEYEFYSIPAGFIRCSKVSIIEPVYDCREVQTKELGEEITLPQHQINLLKEWMDKGIVKVSFEDTRKIVSRDCYNFKFDINAEKLMKEIEFPIYFKEGSANYTIFTCFDKELGLPLSFSYQLILNSSYGKYSLETKFEATKLSLKAGIDKIVLPVSLNEVKWLPNFNIVETLCKPNSNEVKVAIQATKNIPTSLANLTLRYLSYETSGNVSITSSYVYNGSYSVFINPENDNWGGEENYIYKIIDFGNKGRIRWRWLIDDVSRYCGFRKLSYWLDDKRNNVLDFCYAEKEKWYEYEVELNGTHKIGIGIYSPGDGNNDWDAAIDYIEIEKDGKKILYDFESNSLEGWGEYNSKSYKTVELKVTSTFEGAKKDEIKILNFTLPQLLEENRHFSVYLYINNIEQSSYCSTYQTPYTPYPFTGLFTKIMEKIANITRTI